jgi:hypothetical protein
MDLPFSFDFDDISITENKVILASILHKVLDTIWGHLLSTATTAWHGHVILRGAAASRSKWKLLLWLFV